MTNSDSFIDQLLEHFEFQWKEHGEAELAAFVPEEGHAQRRPALILLITVDQEYRWRTGEPKQVEAYLKEWPELHGDDKALVELVEAECVTRAILDDEPSAEDIRVRFPEIAERIDLKKLLISRTIDFESDVPADESRTGDFSDDDGESEDPPPDDQDDLPDEVGRYVIKGKLGGGSFGIVCLAWDPELERFVALKLPRKGRFSNEKAVESFLREARMAARLKHTGLVAVHDIQKLDDGTPYTVQEYIEGRDLGGWVKVNRPSYEKMVRLLIEVAEAVGVAHQEDIWHRDLKPGNILIDNKDQHVHIADFGMAIHESAQKFRKGEVAGSPAYMAPEQVRGETHRLDGRTDIWSLGVILYELLAGRLPFQGKVIEVFEQITERDPRPPRQIIPKIPQELERICLKCLQKRRTDRYLSTAELQEDLGCWLGEKDGSEKKDDEKAKPRLVPKGLRCFDEHDADFFLDILPGPRDRNGLPESIRFWKTRIEETDANRTFAVGLIYGPSGCGKSSLVRAGLLPRLASHVIPICIEATAAETELRLIRQLQRHCPEMPEDLELPEAIEGLRAGRWTGPGQKVVLVLDQFEQFLHGQGGEVTGPLLQALRHCDGGRVQCVVLVRDDFWLATSRFMRALEIELVEGRNMALVDLFDLAHARKVLTQFGIAYGRLPEEPSELTTDQEAFVEQAVGELATDEKTVCVRLALFADLFKGRAWDDSELKKVGGSEGLGAVFLEETFSAATAPVAHRHHQRAAQGVLRALLPDTETSIKGGMRSRGELLDAAGYANREQGFAALLNILDSELRLITPTDPAGIDGGNDTDASDDTDQRYYQLTHDYLVPSLREWLTRKQRETRKGRAELRLAERAALWTAKPETRHLPSLWEWLSIRTLTERKKWTRPQQKMMNSAGRVHSLRVFMTVVFLVALFGIGVGLNRMAADRRADAEARRMVEGLLTANTSEVESLIGDLDSYRKWTGPYLARAYAESPADSDAKLHAGLAFLSEDISGLDYLTERLLNVTPGQFAYVRDLLGGFRDHLKDHCWPIVIEPTEDDKRRFQAACVVATFDAENPRWEQDELRRFVALHLVNVRPSELAPWRDALRPVQGHLVGELGNIYRDDGAGEQARGFATDTLVDYLRDDPDGLFDLLADAEEQQFSAVFERLQTHRDRAVELAEAEVAETIREDAMEASKELLAQRQANAATLLMKLNAAEKAWPLLRHSRDPRVRSYLIHCLSPLGADPRTIIERYESEADVTIKRALLLCLGEFDETQLPPAEREPLIAIFLTVYRTEPDAGLHGAAEWLLQQWGQADRILAIDRGLQQNEEQLRHNTAGEQKWYVNTQGQTFVILDAGTFWMGSPGSEPHRISSERLHERRIERRFAIASKEVTKQQFLAFEENLGHSEFVGRYPKPDCPIGGITWYEAAAYCNWLSKQEGIVEEQWCYSPNKDGKYGPDMRAKENILDLGGYRLPTEAEWEYACRGETGTSRYYGLCESLLPRYARYQANANEVTSSVGSLKPNDFGLFDMLGNVYEWCYDSNASYPERPPCEDNPVTDPVSDTESRVLRGGAFYTQPSGVRSGARYSVQPDNRNDVNGFRPARTYYLSP